ncbi:hypothetical protein EK21DRAFT_54499 [Setomelanomma holmii]|uniref:AB hydrolase-1 domain-containing protein n=1 Tax=Setomelanomma holmii TaxID=210430 RepID=A0A9P4LPT9_9PLEO|nr:hypothetical protein EK21DRAFT_54499 [Setomelanomma holmii]
MDKTSPAIVIVPGLWETGSGVFDQLVAKLKEQELEVVVAELRSTGHGSSDIITLQDDIVGIRSYIEPLVSKGREVVVAAHSAGGFSGSAAVEGLTRKSRNEAGQAGGVIGFAFICAGVYSRGATTVPPPFFEIKGEHVYGVDALSNLFNGLNDVNAQYWNSRMRPQPAANWDAELRFTGHEEVKCHYLVCQQDRLLPVQLRQNFAAARADVTECDAGHMVMLSQVDKLLQFLLRAVENITGRNHV